MNTCTKIRDACAGINGAAANTKLLLSRWCVCVCFCVLHAAADAASARLRRTRFRRIIMCTTCANVPKLRQACIDFHSNPVCSLESASDIVHTIVCIFCGTCGTLCLRYEVVVLLPVDIWNSCCCRELLHRIDVLFFFFVYAKSMIENYQLTEWTLQSLQNIRNNHNNTFR